jgi:hypothetical protein
MVPSCLARWIVLQMKTRAESLDADLDKLKVAFSEISRLSAQVTFEIRSSMSTDPPTVSSLHSAEAVRADISFEP